MARDGRVSGRPAEVPPVGGDAAHEAGEPRAPLPRSLGYVAGAIGVALANSLFWLARGALDAAHVSLLFLIVVAVVAYWAGSGPAVLSAFLSFLSWNYFFIEPTGTFYVHHPRDLIALLVFLAVAVLIGELAGRAREQAVAARERERETAMLYDLSMAGGAEVDPAAAIARVLERLVRAIRAEGAAALLPDDTGALHGPPAAGARSPDEIDPDWRARAAEVLRSGAPIGWDPAGDRGAVYLPLQAGGRIAGVLLVAPAKRPAALSWQSRRLILAAASHLVMATERRRLAAEAAEAEALRATEGFRRTLLSSVSHDLRTPLASIKAAVTSLLHSEEAHSPEARRELLGAVNEEADRLNSFVGALLDLSRLEAGAWRPEREWFDVTEVLGTVLGRLDEGTSARVRVHLAPELPLVPVDCVQIGQALWNVLENALKFSPSGQPVDIDVRVIDPDVLRIEVSDRGPGIPPGEEEHIFEKFYRALGDRRGPGVPGTGLGLAIAGGIVEAHGGRIRARSRPGGGAAFEIDLRLRPPDMPEPPDVVPAEEGESDGR